MSNKYNEVIEGEGEVLLLESVAHSRELKSSLKDKNQDLDLTERGRGELKLWISKSAFDFLSGKQPYGVGGGLFIIYTSKESLGELSLD
jgi:hypothetical protein